MSALTFGSTGASNSVAALGGLGGVLGDRPLGDIIRGQTTFIDHFRGQTTFMV